MLPRFWRVKSVMPSSSHNSTCNEEYGQHWPVGTKFRRLPKTEQTEFNRTYFYLLGNRNWFEQIGGEETIIAATDEMIHRYLEPTKPDYSS